MTDYTEVQAIIIDYLKEFYRLLMNNFTGWNILIQLGVVAGSIVASYPLTKIINISLKKIKINENHPKTRKFMEYVYRFVSPMLTVIFLGVASQILIFAHLPVSFIKIVANFYQIWLVIKLTTLIIDNSFVKKVIQIWFWVRAILSILGIWDKTQEMLQTIKLNFGEVNLELYSILTSFVLAIFLFWVMKKILHFLDLKLRNSKSLRPTMQVLLSKTITYFIYAFAGFMLMGSLGISMTTLSIFTGGIGLGIGIGLQKIFSNLLSGFTLLLDDSIKPGDVIEMGNTYGSVKQMSSRYTSLVTIEGKEILIPNEDLISKPVINWSHSNRLIRVDASIGVSYSSDVHKVKEILEQIPGKFERVLKRPKPESFLKEFGDSSVNFELQFWIRDPQKGIVNIRSEVLLAIWDAFKENNIEIPFPQRDLHIKTSQVDFKS